MTIQEIRQRCQFDHYPEPHERLLRRVSPYMTWVFLKLGFSANSVTYLSIVLGLVGSLVLLLDQTSWWYVSPVLMFVTTLMDHSDGEVARWRGQASLTGLFVDRTYPIIAQPAMFGAIVVRLFMDHPSVWYFVIGLVLMWVANMPRILSAYVYQCFSDGLLRPKKVGVSVDPSSAPRAHLEQAHEPDGISRLLLGLDHSLMGRIAYPFVFLLAKPTGMALLLLVLVTLERASVTILEFRPFAVYITAYTLVYLIVSVKSAVSVVRDRRPDVVYERFQQGTHTS